MSQHAASSAAAAHVPATELLALDRPDWPYYAALGQAVHEAATAVAQNDLTLGWLGPANDTVCTRLTQEHAALGTWRVLDYDTARNRRLPQPPGPVVDVLVLGYAVSQAPARAGSVLGYALRTLREPATTSRLVLLERTYSPLEAFIREAQARLHPRKSRRPSKIPPISVPLRLAWHASWSTYTPADWQWLFAAHGIHLGEAQTLGHGRRYLVATARPNLQARDAAPP